MAPAPGTAHAFPGASVIVATRNRAGQVAQSVDCLLRQDLDRSRYEVIVADDGSTDGTAERLGPLAREGAIVLVELAEWSGRSIARNAALRRARRDVVIFIDSDAFAPPWFVRTHLEAHLRHPASIVDGPAINVDAVSPGAFRSASVRVLAALDFRGEQFVTVNTSCPRIAIERAGGFDEAFGRRYGWEDVELGIRLRSQGLGRVRERAAYVLHAHRRSDLEAEARRQEECGANAIVYYVRHPTAATRRRINVGALGKERVLRRLGLSAGRIAPLASGRSGWVGLVLRPVARPLFLLQRYADGLRIGMAERSVSSFR
jgi:glycosyltransferase involved in cell wall biosynthesis